LKSGTTYSIGIVFLLAILLPRASYCYDPPEIIGVLTSPQDEPYGFASDFCWIGDQNGDGFDDLLVNQDRFPNDTLSHVYLFQGGETLENEPVFTYSSYERSLVIGREVVYFGNINDDIGSIFGFLSVIRGQAIKVDLYTRSHQPDDEVIISMSGENWESAPIIHSGYRDRPKDLNDDGFCDVVLVRQTGASPQLQILYGGGEFDTIPDWSVSLSNVVMYGSSAVYISGGLNINGDDYEDMLVLTYEGENSDSLTYSLYLGGDPPDTLPAVHVRAGDYNLTEQFTMLPDVNGDGYDDWGVYWYTARPWNDGFHIFFGSEEPDGEPDVSLEGARGRWPGSGRIAGGDFNGDGFGDIVATTIGGPDGVETSGLMLHFGNRWFDSGEEEQRADIYVDLLSQYGEFDVDFVWGVGPLGAIGDYNDDGCDDFVARAHDKAFIFAGDEDWVVGVNEPDFPEEYKLSLEATPNPFNDQVTISYQVPVSGEVRLSVYDVQGRLVEQLEDSLEISGEHKLTWQSQTSGIYLILLQTETASVVKKVVCIK